MLPTPENILQARKAIEMTQEAAGQVLGKGNREWRRWESGDTAMTEQAFELFLLKTNQHPTLQLTERDARA